MVITSDIIFRGYVNLCARRNKVFHDCSNIIRCNTKIIVHTYSCFFPPTLEEEKRRWLFYAYIFDKTWHYVMVEFIFLDIFCCDVNLIIVHTKYRQVLHIQSLAWLGILWNRVILTWHDQVYCEREDIDVTDPPYLPFSWSGIMWKRGH